MRARSVRPGSAEKTVRDIRRATRRQYSAEEKIRFVLEGLRSRITIRPPRSPSLRNPTRSDRVERYRFAGWLQRKRELDIKPQLKGRLTVYGLRSALELGREGAADPRSLRRTVSLYDWYVGVRGLGTSAAHVEALWPITGRGAVT
jgi:hypothetical protein